MAAPISSGSSGPTSTTSRSTTMPFTNVMARWNLRRAAADGSYRRCRRRTNSVAGSTWPRPSCDGYDPDTGVYEQFAGFNRLEPLIIEEVAPRRPIAADLSAGCRSQWPERRFMKQADVLLLHHLVPDEVVPGSLEPNLRFYEPRTAHGSSPFPGNSRLAVRARARDFERALESLQLASRHGPGRPDRFYRERPAPGHDGRPLAGPCLRFRRDSVRAHGALQVDPLLPPSWSAMEMRVQFHGSRVRVRIEHAQLILMTDRPTPLVVGSRRFASVSGKIEFRCSGSEWEPIT